ncbi:MAG: hypothetical protein Q7S34_03040 [bacterium]|nr:hypothetical protein [bacterium]
MSALSLRLSAVAVIGNILRKSASSLRKSAANASRWQRKVRTQPTAAMRGMSSR